MRILHIVGKLDRGGAETWLVQLLSHIDREKYQMDFLVHTTEPGAYDEEVRALGARIISCLSPSHPLRYALNFRRILREYGPYDCVHSHVHHFSGFALMLAAMMRVPIRIAHSHNDTRGIDRQSSLLRRAYLSSMETLIRLFSTRGIAVSELAAQSLFTESWESDSRLCVSHLGIDLYPFEQPVCRREVRSGLGILLDAFVVGHVGRFVAQKNHRFLVDIAERFCTLEPKAIFLLVGDGPLKPEIEELVRSRGLTERFIFAGVRQDVPSLMKGAMDCFLFPSLYEGLPLTLLEVQAAGLPCIISDSISVEAAVVKERVRRLSTDAKAEVWAGELFHCARTISNRPSNSIPPELKERSIATSVERMEFIYQSAMSR